MRSRKSIQAFITSSANAREFDRHCWRDRQVTTLKDDMEARKSSRPVMVRNYCRGCKAHVSNDVSDDDGKLLRRVRTPRTLAMR